MERTMSVEEKIRKAEEIYARRQQQQENIRKTTTVSVNPQSKKDIKLLKKMIIQIVVCLIIYLTIYLIQNSNYIFSQDCINKTNEILSYDTNFIEIYQNIKNGILNFWDLFWKMIPEQSISENEAEIMIFQIIELIGSTAYNVILFDEPVTLDEYMPYLERSVRLIMDSYIKDLDYTPVNSTPVFLD